MPVIRFDSQSDPKHNFMSRVRSHDRIHSDNHADLYGSLHFYTLDLVLNLCRSIVVQLQLFSNKNSYIDDHELYD